MLKEFMEEYTRKEKANKNCFYRFNVMYLKEKLRMIYSGICNIIQLLETNIDTKTVGE